MRAFLHVALLVAALGTAAVPGAALAQSASQQFATAQQLYDEGKHAEALPLFQKAHAASNSPNARLYIARCLRELGRLPEAYDEMAATVREASARAEAEPRYAQTRDAAAAELALIERRVGRVIIAIANPPPGVTVTLDGVALPASRIGAPIAVEPGERSITVSAPGRQSVDRAVDVGAGETKTVAVALQAAGSAGGEPGPGEGTGPDTGRRSGGGVRIAGFAVAGLGVAGMALFGVAGLMAESKYSTLEQECGPGPCADPKYQDTIDSGKTLDLLANIGLVAGAVGLAAGGAMIVFGGPSDDAPAAPAAGAGVTVSPRGAMIRGAFVF